MYWQNGLIIKVSLVPSCQLALVPFYLLPWEDLTSTCATDRSLRWDFPVSRTIKNRFAYKSPSLGYCAVTKQNGVRWPQVLFNSVLHASYKPVPASLFKNWEKWVKRIPGARTLQLWTEVIPKELQETTLYCTLGIGLCSQQFGHPARGGSHMDLGEANPPSWACA